MSFKFLALFSVLSAALAAPSGSPKDFFRLGREAFDKGEWRLSLQYMTQVVLNNPHDLKARSYLEAGAQKVSEMQRENLKRARQEASELNPDAMEYGKAQAERWASYLERGGQAYQRGRLLAACDFYHRILFENSLHEEALVELRKSQLGIAVKLDKGAFSDIKQKHLYQAFFHLNVRDQSRALPEFQNALAFGDIFTELTEGDIKRYVDLLSPKKAPVELAQEKTEPKPEPVAVSSAAPAKVPAVDERALAEQRAKALFELAVRLEAQDNLESASRAIKELMAFRAGYPGARQAALRIEGALKERRLRFSEEAQTHYEVGLGFYALGKLDAARKEWEHAVAKDPHHVYAQSAMSRVRRDIRSPLEKKP